ncbi:hypothetical protein NOGI109294_18965 [Nocardiopsis gilva]
MFREFPELFFGYVIKVDLVHLQPQLRLNHGPWGARNPFTTVNAVGSLQHLPVPFGILGGRHRDHPPAVKARKYRGQVELLLSVLQNLTVLAVEVSRFLRQQDLTDRPRCLLHTH